VSLISRKSNASFTQANRRIIDAVAERLGATPEQLFINLDRYGNTSAASVAIALDEAVSSGRIQRGDLILMVVFGAGLTWGAAVLSGETYICSENTNLTMEFNVLVWSVL